MSGEIFIFHEDKHYKYDSVTEQVVSMGDSGVSRKRLSSGCSSFYSKKHEGREVIILVGGMNSGNRFAAENYEVWDFTQQGSQWDPLRKEILHTTWHQSQKLFHF